MLIVADSSALVALALCDGLELLNRLFSDVRVPQAVYDEVLLQEKRRRRCPVCCFNMVAFF
ncbi:hypothetical protein [Candidatus Electronema sp. TJ]|uniref:hypothetical protein n=1 Tax=Candidatus Electronema sp. TJ TaxID=3401573 RepID=UPI003AA7C342